MSSVTPWHAQGEGSALPEQWKALWGTPSPFFRRQLRELKQGFEELASGIYTSEAGDLGELVHPQQNGKAPIHRWYQYKEAFSHRLPREVIARFGAGRSGMVADVFGGVATTALALQCDPRVDRVVSVEYSPLAHLVGSTKLRWAELSPVRLRRLITTAARFRRPRRIELPDLAAFHNPQIFDPRVAADLVAARRHLEKLDVRPLERRFFLIGLAAIVEDVSGAMKDGRALRITRERRRRPSSLVPRDLATGSDGVRRALVRQWSAMVDDLESVAPRRPHVDRYKAMHLRGDARRLDAVACRRQAVFGNASVGLHCYSPPYLNCIDYSEVYKLELWALGLVKTQEEFRQLRLGTLRSHPSIEFPNRPYFDGLTDTAVVEHVEALAAFLERSHARDEIGRMVHNYFADMTQVLREQLRTLEPGGQVVCIVGNSTFSRREPRGVGRDERWRIPMLTDVLLSALARAVGFESAELWATRQLRPRNVNDGAARESFVVLRKGA